MNIYIINDRKIQDNMEIFQDPDFDIISAIKQLKTELNAVILAHYYQDDEIQDIADFIGDSLDLSRKALASDADVIVFCGVKFMAEVAKILSPNKLVLLPDMEAGCSLEQSCKAEDFIKYRNSLPPHIALTYINCSAEVKAASDIIVTSSNAEKIINSIPKDQAILFSPDRNLGAYLAKKTGRDMTLWNGSCIVHETFSEKKLISLISEYPKALVIAHPECPDNLLNYAHHIGSTSSLLKFAKENNGKDLIVLTESGILHQMKKLAPDSQLYAVPALDSEGACTNCNNCEFMKLNTLEKLYLAMKNKAPYIELEPEIANKAKESLNKMLERS